jgi:hypothetical protein
MQAIHLAGIDYVIRIAYVAFGIGIDWTLARYMKTSSDFLTSVGRLFFRHSFYFR